MAPVWLHCSVKYVIRKLNQQRQRYSNVQAEPNPQRAGDIHHHGAGQPRCCVLGLILQWTEHFPGLTASVNVNIGIWLFSLQDSAPLSITAPHITPPATITWLSPCWAPLVNWPVALSLRGWRCLCPLAQDTGWQGSRCHLLSLLCPFSQQHHQTQDLLTKLLPRALFSMYCWKE